MFLKNDEFCVANHEFCIKNHEFCIQNDEFLTKIMNSALKMNAQPSGHSPFAGQALLGGACFSLKMC